MGKQCSFSHHSKESNSNNNFMDDKLISQALVHTNMAFEVVDLLEQNWESGIPLFMFLVHKV